MVFCVGWQAPMVGNAASSETRAPPPAPCMSEKIGLLHQDPYSEALRYQLREFAHFMGPLAFNMTSGHGHFFRIWPAEKQYFPPSFARWEASRMSSLIKRFGLYAHNMGGGPRMIGTAAAERPGRRPRKELRHCQTYNVVCKHTMSCQIWSWYHMSNTQYRMSDIRYRMSRKNLWHHIWYESTMSSYNTYEFVCVSGPTI
jgi:hypothetical protein